MKCPYCQFENSEGSRVCHNCGQSLPPAPVYPDQGADFGNQGEAAWSGQVDQQKPPEQPGFYEQPGQPILPNVYGQPIPPEAYGQPSAYDPAEQWAQSGQPGYYGQPHQTGQAGQPFPPDAYGSGQIPYIGYVGQTGQPPYGQPAGTPVAKKKRWPIVLVCCSAAAVLAGGILFFIYRSHNKQDQLENRPLKEFESLLGQELEEKTELSTVLPSSKEQTSRLTEPPLSSSSQPEQTAVSTAPPVFSGVEASSARYYEGYGSYKADYAVDGDIDTSWVEGAEGTGEGEWIKLKADSPQLVSKVRVLGGYNKAKDLFAQNFQPAVLRVSFSDGSSYTLQCPEGYRQWAELEIPPTETSFVKITIERVYPNSIDDAYDTCISEIEVS